MSITRSKDLPSPPQPEILMPLMSHIVFGAYMANEKFQFAAKKNEQSRLPGDFDPSDPIFARGTTWFLDRLGIPHEKGQLFPKPNPAYNRGACWCIVEPTADGRLVKFAFNGRLDERDRNTTRTAQVSLRLDLDSVDVADSLARTIEKGSLQESLLPLLTLYFTVQRPDGAVVNLFDASRKQHNIMAPEYDEFNIPMSSLVVGKRQLSSEPLKITFDNRPEKTFVTQIGG